MNTLSFGINQFLKIHIQNYFKPEALCFVVSFL